MRPSLAVQRESEILDAIEACIREVGIGGLTTGLIAEKSGYSRSHIRHYLGNKADQLQALVNLYTERYAGCLEELVLGAPTESQRDLVVRELFGDTWQISRPDDDIVLDHLNAYASTTNPDSPSLAPMYSRIVQLVAHTLEPHMAETTLAVQRAQLVVSLAYGVTSLLRLGIIDRENALQHARALMLLD